MPSLTHSVPKYRHHKASGQAVVTLAGRDHYLGLWKSKGSRTAYDRLVGEWIAAGRPTRSVSSQCDLSITELCAAYWRFAKAYYVKNGRPTNELPGLKTALRMLRTYYDETRVVDFGPLALKALRNRFVEAGHGRPYVNQNTGRIRRMFKWGVAEELVPPAVFQAISAVSGLRRGKTEAHESTPVTPVSDTVVDSTLPFLPPVVAAMVAFQRATGARPSEVCMLRPCDVDMADQVWCYIPESHKTEHHGRERRIYIGPKGQSVLRPYLLRDKSHYCFVPAESEHKRNADRRANRRSPLTPSQAERRPIDKRTRPAGRSYTKDSYRRAVARAIELANRQLQAEEVDAKLIPHWHPNQLRHSTATEVRRRFGLEAAQVALGHSKADITQVYAERDFTLAQRVMGEVG